MKWFFLRLFDIARVHTICVKSLAFGRSGHKCVCVYAREWMTDRSSVLFHKKANIFHLKMKRNGIPHVSVANIVATFPTEHSSLSRIKMETKEKTQRLDGCVSNQFNFEVKQRPRTFFAADFHLCSPNHEEKILLFRNLLSTRNDWWNEWNRFSMRQHAHHFAHNSTKIVDGCGFDLIIDHCLQQAHMQWDQIWNRVHCHSLT